MTEFSVRITPDVPLRPVAPALYRPLAKPRVAHPAEDRFRRLLRPSDWQSLPSAVRERFSRQVADGGQRTFVGTVVRTSHSRLGYLLAQLARLAGGPLPDTPGATGPSTVTVTRDEALDGQIWTRTYARPGRLPQTINSVKRFTGPTGLEEFLGYGLLMRLTLAVESGALVFRSAGYDFSVAGRRIVLPRVFAPGNCTIAHRDLGDGRFSFTLTLDHPWFGRLVEQVAVYEEITA